MRKSFTDGFKQAAVQKIMLPGGPGMMELSRKIGVHHTTIRRWRDLYATSSGMKTPTKWTPERELQAIAETASLSDAELGEYLRKHGLHSHEIEEWKSRYVDSQKSRGRPRKDPDLKASLKREKALEQDLRRKEKALAEMTARVILLKKSHLLWGEPGEEDE